MKRVFAVILTVALVLCFGATAFAATEAVSTVTVSAKSELEIEPDIAYVNLGVRTEAKTANEAKKENTAAMNKVVAALKKAGVAGKDIATSNLYMNTEYNWDNEGNRTIVGYTVTNTLKITIHDVDAVGDMVDAAMNAGANQFNNVQFDLEDSEEAYLTALASATKKAAKRAAAIAAAAGKKLGDPLSLSTTGLSYSPVYQTTAQAEDVDEEPMMDTGVAEEGAPKNVGSTIQKGMITVSATINASYLLK